MCLNPTLIPNPWANIPNGEWLLKDTKSKYVAVPCGHCSECVATRALAIRQRCELEEMQGHPFMLFLSYSNKMIPKYTCSNGFEVRYAYFKDVTDMFKRLRKSNALTRPFRYLVISERGGQKGRIHFHGVIYLQKYEGDTVYTILNLEQILHDEILKEWRRNYGSNRNPIWEPLCTPMEYVVCGKRVGTYGLHFIQSFNDGTTLGATQYVSKYFLKRDAFTIKLQQYLHLNLEPDEYKKVWKFAKTRYISSLNFGFGLYGDYNAKTVSKQDRLELLSSLPTFQHVKDSLDRSLITQDKPRYFELESGKPIPLARYFYRFGNLYDYHVYSHFKDLNNEFGDYAVFDSRDETQLLYDKSIKDKQIDSTRHFTDFTDLI